MLKRLFNRSGKTHQVYVEPFGATVTVNARETILQAALNAGVAYPYECQTGACSTCKTQLIEGKIKTLTDFAYVLDMEEIKGGTILACQSLAKTDLKVRVNTLDDGLPTIEARKICGRVVSVSNLTRDIFDVRVALNESINYYAGQYANLTLPTIAVSRSYSFATAPLSTGRDEISFHVRLIPNGELSSWITVGDRSGEPVEIDGPYGIFRLRNADAPIICIAGGSGMAPIKAMLEQGGAGSNRPIVYLYGGRTQRDLYDDDVIDRIIKSWSGPIRFLPVLSEEPQDSDWVGARGLVTDFIKSISEFEVAEAQAYLCGPPLMIDAAITILTSAGMRGRNIYFDKFTESGSTQ